jgi:hypothetical protein
LLQWPLDAENVVPGQLFIDYTPHKHLLYLSQAIYRRDYISTGKEPPQSLGMRGGVQLLYKYWYKRNFQKIKNHFLQLKFMRINLN